MDETILFHYREIFSNKKDICNVPRLSMMSLEELHQFGMYLFNLFCYREHPCVFDKAICTFCTIVGKHLPNVDTQLRECSESRFSIFSKIMTKKALTCPQKCVKNSRHQSHSTIKKIVKLVG